MRCDNFVIDAVVRRPDTSRGAPLLSSVSVQGCGMRRALPMILETAEAHGGRVVRVILSEIEVTVVCPREDAGKVFRALTALIGG